MSAEADPDGWTVINIIGGVVFVIVLTIGAALAIVQPLGY